MATAIKKKGIPFPLYVDIGPDKTGLEATFSLKYRKQGETGAFTVASGAFVAITENPGEYRSPYLTLTDTGEYEIIIGCAYDGGENISGVVRVVEATEDDVWFALQALQADLTSVKGQVDVLDETTLNAIQADVNGISAKLVELKALLTDTDDAAIRSLKEFLISIENATASGNTVLSVLEGYTDDIEAMLSGADTLKDGSANPLKGNTNIDVMNLLRTTSAFLDNAISTTKTAILEDAQAKYNTTTTRLQAIVTAIAANNTELTDSTHGLTALRTVLDSIKADTTGGTQSIIDVLNSPTIGLEAIKNAIASSLSTLSTKVDGVDTKVTTAIGKIDSIATNMNKTVTARVFG